MANGGNTNRGGNSKRKSIANRPKLVQISQALEQQDQGLLAALPPPGPDRLRYLCGLTEVERKRLCRLSALSNEESRTATQAKKNAVLAGRAAALLGVRTADLSRWDEEGRLPHAFIKRVSIQGKMTPCRTWLLEDLRAAQTHVLAWIEDDIRQTKIRSSTKIPALTNPPAPIQIPALLPPAPTARKLAPAEPKPSSKRAQKRSRRAHQQATLEQALQGTHWLDFYPNPARGKRELFAILGPTNSGKTYQALQDLKGCTKETPGIYLAPLRLLAMEVFDQLRREGLRVSLLTGEEQEIDPEAQITCSTIEMLDTQQSYRVAIIDEAQMILDAGRGWAWTRAFLQANAKRLYLLGSPGIEALAAGLSALSGEALTIQRKERISPLHAHNKTVPSHQVPNGSIFVVFSRNAVIRWSEIFRSQGRRVAHIYGAMPPEVRREEARRFRDGEAEILIATDAIAMGLNLPAHTVILAESTKFDGTSMGPVPLSLVRQIIGRAGRFGHHEEGWCAGIDAPTHHLVCKAHHEPDPNQWNRALYLQPSEQWLQIVQECLPKASLSDVLQGWREYVKKQAQLSLRSSFDEEASIKATVLDDPAFAGIPLHQRFSYLAAPVAIKEGHLTFFRELLKCLFLGKDLTPDWAESRHVQRNEQWELLYKKAGLYIWFHYRCPKAFPDMQIAKKLRNLCVQQIRDNIKKGLDRRCRECGAPLSPKSRHSICENCYEKRLYRYYW